ncbi:HEAT repeat domain-containing protein [Ornithinimicrobium sp. Y1847]|uniref:HEAT repeat domain-containing protein n=1 Tax=Ornithinimicrobium sp. Y1847 TaxID=3405419 RepID=UPI003B66E58D
MDPTQPEPTPVERALAAALHTDSSVRQEAALRLGTVAEDEHAPAMVAMLVSEPDFYVRETLTWAVVARGAAAMPHLLAALEGDEPSRVQVLHALSKLQDPAAVEHILPLANDPDDAVAAKAWWALGRTGTPEAAPALLAHLGDTDEARRRELSRALEQLGEPAVAGLAERLADPESDLVTRRHAAEVLVLIGDPGARGAVDALIGAVEGDEKEVAVIAVEALAALDDPRVDEALQRLRDGEDRWLAITAEWLLSDRGERSGR